MLNISNNGAAVIASAQPQIQFVTPHFPEAGQIWRDTYRHENNRLILVLYRNHQSVVCQNLRTGKITSVRIEQFNRGRTGYSYHTTLSKLSFSEFKNTLRFLTQSFGDHITKLAGDSLTITIRRGPQ